MHVGCSEGPWLDQDGHVIGVYASMLVLRELRTCALVLLLLQRQLAAASEVPLIGHIWLPLDNLAA